MQKAEHGSWKLPNLTNKARVVVDSVRRKLAGLSLALGALMLMGGFSLRTALVGASIGDGSTNGTLGLLLLFGAIIILLIGVVLFAAHAIPPHPSAVTGLMGVTVVLIVLAFLVPALTPATASVASATGTPAAISTYILPSTDVVAGCTVGSANLVMTCDADYNMTSNSVYLCTGNLTAGAARTACATKNFIMIAVHSARTDILNSTYGFPYSVASVPVTTIALGTSIGTSYSPITGYTVASGTTPATWQTYWSLGSTAALNPTNVAPTSASGFTPSSTAIAAFGSATQVLHISLVGSNSTFHPTWSTSLGAPANIGITQFATYTESITIGNSSPVTLTLNVIIIGFTS
jgi:hypothetical protein